MWAGDVAFAVFGLLAYLMFKDDPPRMPKVATIFAIISGVGFVGGVVSGWIVDAIDWLVGFLPGWIGVPLVALTFVFLLYKVGNHLWPRMGRIAGGTVSPSIAVMAFLLPLFGSLTGGEVNQFVENITGQVSGAAVEFTADWF